MSIEAVLLIAAVLLAASVLISKASERFGVPTMLIFLAVGMLAGSEGVGGIYFDNPRWPRRRAPWPWSTFFSPAAWKPTGGPSGRCGDRDSLLATVGVLSPLFSLGVFVTSALDFSPLEGLLVGSIVASTDAAAVFAISNPKASV
jgi:cell volume regulation protein A